MAKSFKNPRQPAPGAEPVKPISERDFFDLTDEPLLEPARSRHAASQESSVVENTSNTDKTDNSPVASNTSNSSNTSNGHHKKNTGNSKNTGNAQHISDTSVTANALAGSSSQAALPAIPAEAAVVPQSGSADERDVRQTFVVSRSHFERLRDYVHARRAGGEYEYSQKQALQEALELLFSSVDPVPPRPAQARASEQRRSERIRRGRTR